MLMPPLRSPADQAPAWSPSVSEETKGTQSLLLSSPQGEGCRGQQASPRGPPSPGLSSPVLRRGCHGNRCSWSQ